jgi:hypothetical protein
MGGEPERDESGLPPVDIEIPDDARELDRDIQAYYRELRAERRRRRVERLTAPFTRHGMAVPLVAGTLAITLFAGTMLTMITSAPEQSSVPPSRVIAPASVPPAGKLGGLLPDAAVLIDNKPSQLRDLGPSVLAIVPPRCGCLVALQQLTGQAIANQIKIYFVGTARGLKQLASLSARAGRRNVQVVNDAQNILGTYYHPIGLTAILVHSDSAVTSVERNLVPGLNLQAKLGQLGLPGLGYVASPAPG